MIEASDKLKNLIAGMTLRNSYWGYLFSRIRRIPDKDMPSIMGISYETGGVLGLRFHPYLVENTDDNQLCWILEHEGMHVINMHIPRLLRIIGDELDKKILSEKIKIWNKASDCCVNSQIKDFPKNIIIDGKPWPGEFPSLYKMPNGKSTEFYFWELMKNNKSNNRNDDGNGDAQNDNSDKKSNTGKGNGNTLGKEYKGFDSHEGWQSGDGDTLDPYAMARRVETYTQDIVRQSIKNFNKNRGKLSGNVMELIDELLQPPKAPYYQIIRKLVVGSRLSKFKPCSTRINRKRTYVFNLEKYKLPQISPFPGKVRDKTFSIGILIDTSGSQGKDDLMEALSGIKNIIENDRNCEVTVIEIDTEIHKEYKIKRLSDIDFEIKGRGGTTLRKGLFRFKELNVDIMLAFSDGYCDNLNELPRKSIPKKNIWIIPEKNGSVDCVNRTGYIVRI